jgi:3D (Asp-Asp-Asp) domain-containing protein
MEPRTTRTIRRGMQVLLLGLMFSLCLVVGFWQVDKKNDLVQAASPADATGLWVAINPMPGTGEAQSPGQSEPGLDGKRWHPLLEQPNSPVPAVGHLSSRSGGHSDTANNAWLTFRATWYSSQDGGGQGTVTATGTRVKDDWTVAVDPHMIPLGSIIQVRFEDGTVHVFQALDTGGAIVGNHIDIFNHSRAACIRNGVQPVGVRIIGIHHP